MHEHSDRLARPPVILIGLAAIMLIVMGWIGHSASTPIQIPATPGEESVEGRVLAVLQQDNATQAGVNLIHQKLWVEILTGSQTGKVVSVDLTAQGTDAINNVYQANDQLQITRLARPDGVDVYYATDPIRLPALILLALLFAVFITLVSGWKGVRSLIGMAISLYVITQFILPLILIGQDPVLITILGAFGSLSVTQYLIYGWAKKSHAAIIGIFISLVLTGLLAVIFVGLTRLNGFGSEDMGFLQSIGLSINPRGLLLAGILIGTLGVLDDVTISQASAVFELAAANSALTVRELYRRAMNIGRDHIASTVNTLVLAYVGASLPLLLLFVVYPQPFGQIVNREFIAEEIVQTLIGSMGLIAAVPITTLLAGVLAHRSAK